MESDPAAVAPGERLRQVERAIVAQQLSLVSRGADRDHAVGRQRLEQGRDDRARAVVHFAPERAARELVDRTVPLAPRADEPRFDVHDHVRVRLQERRDLRDVLQDERKRRVTARRRAVIAEPRDELHASYAAPVERCLDLRQEGIRKRSVAELTHRDHQPEHTAPLRAARVERVLRDGHLRELRKASLRVDDVLVCGLESRCYQTPALIRRRLGDHWQNT